MQSTTTRARLSDDFFLFSLFRFSTSVQQYKDHTCKLVPGTCTGVLVTCTPEWALIVPIVACSFNFQPQMTPQVHSCESNFLRLVFSAAPIKLQPHIRSRNLGWISCSHTTPTSNEWQNVVITFVYSSPSTSRHPGG
jgi:hypothetical protein